jgi:hypothetical protein
MGVENLLLIPRMLRYLQVGEGEVNIRCEGIQRSVNDEKASK